MTRSVLIFIFCGMIYFLSGSAKGQDLDRIYIDTGENNSAMILTDGTYVVVDWITQTVEVNATGSDSFTFSINEVIEHVESDPAKQDQLYQEIQSALTDPETSAVYLPERDPNLGLTGSSNDDGSGGGGLSPDPIIGQQHQPGSEHTLESSDIGTMDTGYGEDDGACIYTIEGHVCMPWEEWEVDPDEEIRYGNFGNGFGSRFGSTVSERECAMAHYRGWLDSQGSICNEAVALQSAAVGAGAVALGACRQFAAAPNPNSGLVCAGSYLGVLAAAWLGNRRVNDCTRNYPGPGGAC